jgi:glycosyltransferase involved in cell wall biosynthesis
VASFKHDSIICPVAKATADKGCRVGACSEDCRVVDEQGVIHAKPTAAAPGPRRVLHVVWDMNMGGLEQVVMSILRGADPARLRFDVLTQSAARPYFAEEIASLGARWLPGEPMSRPGAYLRRVWQVLRHEGPYDVVHCHLHRSSPPALLLAMLAGVPTRVSQSHNDVRSLDGRRSLRGRAAAAAARTLTWASCTHAIAVSERAARSLYGHRRGPRLVIQPSGVDLRPFANGGTDPYLRAALGLPSDATVIGTVARFAPVKNHARTVRLAAEVIRTLPTAHFLFVGDGPQRPSIQQQVRAAGLADRFTFTGNRHDVPEIMKSAMDVFLLPTHYEGLGIVVVEAQAAGLPCVVSETVPSEALVVPELVAVVELSAPDVAWARALAAAPARRQAPGGEAYQRCVQSPCGLDHFQACIDRTYRAAA